MRTPFEDVYSMFLSKITSYDYLNLTNEELNIELNMLLRKGMAKFVNIKEVTLNDIMEEFSRELTSLEQGIISDLMVIEWMIGKIYNIELFKQNLSSKDYNVYSQANHLKSLIDAKNDLLSNVHYWMSRYDWKSNLSTLKGGGK